MGPKADISVCICTYNRSSSLRRTLASLCNLVTIEPRHWGVCVIDNNSSDATSSVVREFENRLPLKYILETNQGLSFARNRALNECAADAIIFIDDDVEVAPDWLARYLKAFSDFPEAGYFGGRILPRWPQGRPKWLKDERDLPWTGVFVCHDLGETTRLYREGDPIAVGASFALRRSLFKKMEPFRTDLGVSGSALFSGEETEYIKRARAIGAQGVYAGEALCHHAVDPKRLGLKHMYEFGVYRGLTALRTTNVSLLEIRRRYFLFSIKTFLRIFGGGRDGFFRFIISLGALRGVLGRKS